MSYIPHLPNFVTRIDLQGGASLALAPVLGSTEFRMHRDARLLTRLTRQREGVVEFPFYITPTTGLRGTRIGDKEAGGPGWCCDGPGSVPSVALY